MTQEQAFEIMKAGENIYLTGSAGTGKTFLLNKFIKWLSDQRIGVGITAATGIAATHIGGVSIHSWSGLGVRAEISTGDMEKILKIPRLKRRFRQTEVLIIDEISMLHAWQLDLVNQICQAFNQDLRPFGGLQVVMSGDLFQLPPVVRGGGSPEFMHESNVWKEMNLKVCYLEQQFRQKDNQLLQILNEIRSGSIGEDNLNLLIERIDREFKAEIKPTKLYTHNADVDRINFGELRQLEGGAKAYNMNFRGNKYLVEALKYGCLAPERLELRLGAEVMFVKNNFEEGYVNGTRGRVVDFSDEGFPLVQTAGGDMIEAYPMEWTIEEEGKVRASIIQVPLRLAWAITVHKSQGMSLDAAEVDLSKSFVPGMGYVALSRVRSLDGLILRGINDMALKVSEKVMEIDCEFNKLSKQAVSDLELGRIKLKKERKPKSEIKTIKRVPNRERTRKMIEEKKTIKEIADALGFKQRTIITHIEQLALKDRVKIDIEYLLPEDDDRLEIAKAFEKLGIDKLRPIFEELGEKYDYDKLSLVRIWMVLNS